jgi:hypothetical protein
MQSGPAELLVLALGETINACGTENLPKPAKVLRAISPFRDADGTKPP